MGRLLEKEKRKLSSYMRCTKRVFEKAEKKRTQDFAHLRFAKNTEKMIGFYLCKRRGKSGKKTAGFACRECLQSPKARVRKRFLGNKKAAVATYRAFCAK